MSVSSIRRKEKKPELEPIPVIGLPEVQETIRDPMEGEATWNKLVIPEDAKNIFMRTQLPTDRVAHLGQERKAPDLDVEAFRSLIDQHEKPPIVHVQTPPPVEIPEDVEVPVEVAEVRDKVDIEDPASWGQAHRPGKKVIRGK